MLDVSCHRCADARRAAATSPCAVACAGCGRVFATMVVDRVEVAATRRGASAFVPPGAAFDGLRRVAETYARVETRPCPACDRAMVRAAWREVCARCLHGVETKGRT